MHLRSYLAPLQITPTWVGASPSLLVLSIWKWINFSFGQSTVALNRPSRLQRGLSPHRFSSPKIPFIEHTPSCVCGLSAQEILPSAVSLRGSAPQFHLHVYLCWCCCVGKSWPGTIFSSNSSLNRAYGESAPVVHVSRPSVRKS